MRLASAVLLGIGVQSACAAEEALPPPTIETVLESNDPTVSRVRWQAGSDRLLIEVAAPGQSESSIKVIPIGAGSASTLGAGSFVSPSPDGTSIVWLSGKEWVLFDTRTGVTRTLAVPSPSREYQVIAPSAPEWSVDSRYIAFARTVWPNPNTFEWKAEEIKGVEVIDVGAQVDARPQMTTELVVLDLEDIDAPSRTISVDGVVTKISWGEGDRLFLVRNRYYDYADQNPATVVFDWMPGRPDLKEVHRVSGRMQFMSPAVSPAARWLAVAADIDSRIWSDFVSLVLVDLSTGGERRLTSSLRVSQDYVWASDSHALYFTARHGAFDWIYHVDMDGILTLVSGGDRHHYDLQISPDGTMLSFQTLDGYGRRDVRVLSLVEEYERVLVTIAEPARKFRLGEFLQIRWPNGEGQEIFGFLILPPEFDRSQKYPMLVDVHGGGPGSRLHLKAPITRHLSPGPLEWHAWAALGYVVFVPDYRSSGSYGPETVADRYRSGDFAGIQADGRDVLSGTRFVAESWPIDQKRIGIFGHSAGGARVHALLTLTEVYQAAVLHEPIPGSALDTLYLMSSGPYTGLRFEGTLTPMLGATLAEAPDLYSSSLLIDGYRIRTPTLLLVGGSAADGAVSSASSETLFTILRQYDVPTRMVRFVKEGHNYRDPAAAALAFHETRRWFDAHMPFQSLTDKMSDLDDT